MSTTSLNSTEANKKRPLAQKILVVMGMMSLIGGTLTAIMTAVNVGLSQNFLQHWLPSFTFAVLVMMPAGFILMTLMSKLADLLLSNANKTQRNIAVGIGMAFFMESVLAAVTTANNIGLTSSSAFLEAWSKAFIVALPFGLGMAVIMSLTLKPKLEAFMAS
ncbi:DUF2798 domain-containing protein [Agaribacterium sp. ZY112]|uniref:DUF2798 domain-containing protein n=1 Tax=Agaribacterium sp. ZY112 TaxID=3233574 RepID=UPI0035234AD7